MEQNQEPEIARKNPVQARSKQTVETILEATARILEEEGGENLTTNHLARRAGFSIGTIYQYFPNREAIVLALIERQREATWRRIETVLDDGRFDTAEAKVRQIVRILHEAFNVHRMPQRRLVRALLQLAIAQGVPAPPDRIGRLLFVLAAQACETDRRQPDKGEAFVLTHSLFETLRQATLQSSPLLGTAGFEDALVRLVFGFVRESATR
ncbi:TetR/AcrR family transcriptional regulator [Stakelama sp. CBK3Z-3]|uniref:TetR/AcrR family transcriptional regulator n=1 Tax=Stakelama flava TaxID=2860338 RepID=A0ABS6XMU6_9SPHN|nr:TetR/AcrR family transcriptional regulator [Stakelama flava]MBW4331476.1 TetR/AcrR family transcriptional regulator [Stakelama flava]